MQTSGNVHRFDDSRHHHHGKQKGQIQLILGPMFSGKSTELLRRIRIHTVAGRKCVLVNYLGDNRYPVTNDGSLMKFESKVNRASKEVFVHPSSRSSGGADASSNGEEEEKRGGGEEYDRGELKSSGSNHIITHERVAAPSHGERYLEGFETRINGNFDEVEVIGIDEAQFFPDISACADKWANMGKIVIVAALDGTFKRTGFGDIPKLFSLSESVFKLSAVCHYCANDASFSLRIGSSEEIEVIGGEEEYHATCRECYNEKTNSNKLQ